MPRRARENTLPSFALALDAGADALELDVHATADGVVVAHHDPVVPHGPEISEVTLAELRRHEAAPGVPIPTLGELCALVAGRAMLFVEIKGAGIERTVLGALEAYTGPFAIHSFDHAMIRRLHQQAPEVRLGVLLEHEAADVAGVMVATGAVDVWPHWPLVTEELITTVHRSAGRVIPWTVNDAAGAAALATMGVDGICSDDVTLLPQP
jgi:glycerophosphoryl diester phosphodiesterase